MILTATKPGEVKAEEKALESHGEMTIKPTVEIKVAKDICKACGGLGTIGMDGFCGAAPCPDCTSKVHEVACKA